ncbi:MAG: glycosyltransferase, partial [Pseudanabaena sp.]
TNTEGQSEILSRYPEVGELIPSNDPIALANAINNLVNNYPKILFAKQAALKAAQSQLNWESQTNIILRTLEKAIK